MKVLKGLALSLLSFLLFISLSVFGLAFMVDRTVLNPHFVISELDRLDFAAIVEEASQGQAQDFPISIPQTISKIQPQLKNQIDAAVDSIYDYILGKKPNPDLVPTLKSTILSGDFLASLSDQVDFAPLIKDYLLKQFGGQIPKELQPAVSSALDKTLAEQKPWLKQQINAAADPVASYMLGQSQGFNMVIPLQPFKDGLRKNLPAQLQQYVDVMIPSTYPVNPDELGLKQSGEIAKAIADAEQRLREARQVISYFQTYYVPLIILMVLLVVGIAFLSGGIKPATRNLGTTFLTYGIFEFAGVLIGNYFIGKQLPAMDVPPSLQAWLPQFINDFFAPLVAFSLGCLIGGAILIIVSFIYRPKEKPA